MKNILPKILQKSQIIVEVVTQSWCCIKAIMANIANFLEMGSDQLIDIRKLVNVNIIGFPEGNEACLS